MKTSQRHFVPDFCQTEAVLTVIVLAQIMVFVFALMSLYFTKLDWGNVGAATIFTQWVALSSAALLCSLKNALNRIAKRRAAVFVVLIVMFVTLVFSLIAHNVERYVMGLPWQYWHDKIWVDMGIAALVSTLLVQYLYVRDQVQQRSRAESEARLQTLQARIQPHFLFNSMNIIASLIPEQPDYAEQAVEDLAELLRNSLRAKNTIGTLQDEIELCQRYGRLEQWRMGHRLTWQWQVGVDTQAFQLPMLTVQPLLENAVYHGVQNLEHGGTVAIRIYEDEAFLFVVVCNPMPSAATKQKGLQIAMQNTRARLQEFFGTQAIMSSVSDGDHYEVKIKMPKRGKHARSGV